MHSKNVMLTIGIPTFNGCEYIEECIEKILIQSDLLDQIEILVCDNASSDDTENIMHNYTNKYPDVIRYIRHDSNLGMDKNFWSCIENARGEFVHLMGDDDYYTENGLRRLVNLLHEKQDLDAICLSNNYLNTLNNKIIDNKEVATEDIFCQSGTIFFLSENLKTLTLSNIVVKRSKCLEIVNIEKLFGTNWLHLGILTEIIKPTSKAYVFNFNNPLVTVRIGNQRWLEKDGAISYYYSALSVYSRLNSNGYRNEVFNHVKTLFWQLLLNGSRINFHNKILNIKYSFKLLRFYYDQPFKYIKFSAKLILLKHKPFFEGWN
jgi:glycosyltransferase involved in cell wall biosynthesis